MNPTYESLRCIVNPMHSSSPVAEIVNSITTTMTVEATMTDDVFDPIEAFNVFQFELEFEMSETDILNEQSRIDEIRQTLQNCPVHPNNIERQQARQQANQNSETHLPQHNHQCKACHCFGHQMKNCTDPLVVGQLTQDKNIFHRLFTNRLREPQDVSIEFCDFAVEIHATPKNLLKYLVMQYGGKTRRVNKMELGAKYLYYLFENSIRVSLNDGVFTTESYIYQIVQEEKKYWLNIGNGISMSDASEMYDHSLSELVSAASVLNELYQANESHEDRNHDPFENLDIKMLPIEHLTLVDDFECCICFETINEIDSVELNCEHSFCAVCVSKTINNCNKSNTTPKCALCRTKYIQLKIKTENARNILSKKIIKI